MRTSSSKGYALFPKCGTVRFLSFLTSLFLALAGTSAAMPEDSSGAELRIVFIAYQNPDQLMEDVRPVVKYLEEALKMNVKPFVSTDYAGVVEALRNETADVGFMGPLQYIIAHNQAGAYPILGEIYNGRPTYESRIFVRKDSGIKSLEDLKGKSIAFVDPISSSGYMYPLEIFREKGLFEEKAEEFFSRVYFSGGDEQAIRAVYNKFVDAAGIGEFSHNLLRAEERDEVISIAESRRLPSHCLVVRKRLDPAVVRKVQDAFLALNEGDNGKLLKYLYSVDGYIKVTHETYAEVEQVARKYGFIKP